MIVTFGESTMSRTQVQFWYKWFNEGRENVNDNARCGRPSSSTTDENIEALKKMIFNNRRITIREVADDVGISFGSCQAIFTDVLGIKRVAAKIVPKLLNFLAKKNFAQEMLTTFNDDRDLRKKIITGDES